MSASIICIESIASHSKDANWEIARFLNKQVVVKADSFLPGEFAIWFRAEVILPIWFHIEIFRSCCHYKHLTRANNFRVRNTTIKGQRNQGFIMPISILSQQQTNKGLPEIPQWKIRLPNPDLNADWEDYVTETASCVVGQDLTKFFMLERG